MKRWGLIVCCLFLLGACSVGGGFGVNNGGAGIAIGSGISF
ncbi:hypothetical protein EDC45_1607 [Mesocricetibacter intestinalis]|uniref:Lipoprotein n=1 Tax=Mesocricetibacter intestinalis TaxID=1521930 RepID=A0A4R6V7X1_9PAST|nr:hypothetical protein [Mesocricetibacter intestinalis]TDQ57211.1 hypothetical protein EDC45_1607 [Mesocricetibacter intestinalis]